MKKFDSVIEIKNYIINRQKETGKYISIKFLLGNGDKKQYKDRKELEKTIEKIANRYIYKPNDEHYENLFIYFGDVPKKDAPDIGYAYEYLAKIRPDIIFIMIQIKEMEKYGVPKFVNGGVYFHNDYDEKHKWGGFEDVNGKLKVYSNTKQWLKLHLLLKKIRQNDKKRGMDTSGGFDQCYFLGEGGPISKEQYKLVRLLNDYNVLIKGSKNDIDDAHIKKLESRY